MATLEPWRLLYRHVHPDGRIVWAEGKATPERQPDGSTLWYGFIADVTARVEAERKLREQEALYRTVLDNLQEICYVAEVTGERVARKGDRCAVLMLDLDHFKAVNDRYGHAVGDTVLRSFAEILRDSLRSSDLAGRVGGEEFAVLLPHTDLAGALLLAERIRHAVASYCRVPQHPELRMTVSIGASELLPEDPSPEVALARADAALYRAKQEGRNRVVAACATSQPD